MALEFNSSGAYSPQSATDTQLSLFADQVSKQRSIDPILYKQIQDARYFMGRTSMIGSLINNDAFMGVPVDTEVVYHAEENSVFNRLNVIGSVPVNAAGAETTITVTAETFGTPTQYFNYAVVDDVLEGVVQNVGMRVTAVSFPDNSGTHTVTLQADGIVISDYISTGDKLRPQYSVNNIDSDFPKGSISGIARYGVQFQPMMTSSAEVGQGGYNQGFEFELADGQKFIAPRAIMQATLRSWIKKAVAVSKASGQTYTKSGVQTTETVGLVTAFRTYGLTANYVPGAFQATALKTIGLKMNNRGAGSEATIWGGAAFLPTLQDNALSTLTGGAVVYISAEQNEANERASLRKALGKVTYGKYVYTLNEAAEWSHPEIFNPDTGGNSLLTNAWPNSFAINPDMNVAVPRGLSNTSHSVDKPQFRVLQLQAPVTIGGPKVMKQVVQVNPANVQKFQYYLTIAEYFAAQTMLARMGYWGGSVQA